MPPDRLIKSPSLSRPDRLPPGQTITDDWPVLHVGEVPIADLSTWTFTIFGLVEQKRVLTYQEFTALPKVKVLSDLHCVEGWSRLDCLWEGVSTSVIKGLVSIRPEATFAMVHAERGFTTNLPLDDFFQPDVLFVLKYNDKPLPIPHGGPLRLVVPRLYFWKSAKWATGVEFMAADKPGFWESRGYHMHGDPWKEERLSPPV